MIRRLSHLPLAIAFTVFLTLLGVSHLVVSELAARTQAAADLRFNEFATDASNKVQVQLLRYTDILLGLRGLWSVTGAPTTRQFLAYHDALRIHDRFPALVNINFNEFIATADTARYERQIRQTEHLTNFTIFPKATTLPHRLVVRFDSSPHTVYLGRDIYMNYPESVTRQVAESATAVTSGLAIPQLDDKPGAGLGIRLAIYRSATIPPPGARMQAFAGSVGIFVDCPTLIHEAIPAADRQYLALTFRSLPLSGEAELPTRRTLYRLGDSTLAPAASVARIKRSFFVADRVFELDFTVAKDRFKDPIGAHIQAIGYSVGILLSVISAAVIYLLLASQRQLSTTVTSQSASLASTRDQVDRLLRERLQAEQELARQGERERQRIGRELHDDLGQKLTGASLMLETLAHSSPAASDDVHRQSIDKIAKIVEGSIATIRTLSRGLTPFDGSPHDLGAALRELCDEIGRLLPDGCHLDLSYDTELLSQDASLHLYRIVQESISNALRHGRARRIDVQLLDIDGRIALTVRDDGIGLPGNIDVSDLPTTSVGLRSIRSRAQLLGMRADFRRGPDGGVIVEVK
ncbi:Oxygen sensor histidine kinase NreB [Pandoraea pneumonica]|uniref:Oxygen sensor histidine kinase NreB n=1 Tax=Pandoraea pneumonica TaxID=2508299 RepID=A0A5E4VXU6_9BURK|nr:histidine kinase [Pandoraea pneumonica]VVE16693.1 Oxygen sensor histidine kinase NreB [Pandoraea pneumonica]